MEDMLYTGCKHFIEPNGFASMAWCFGKHDRSWKERPILGKIRCISAKGLERKFYANEYVKRLRLE